MLLSSVVSQAAQAHAEHDKARFVAVNGEDVGACDNRFRPCQSVSYAAQRAAKGDKILVAQGQYRINNEQDLLYFSGQLVPVLGGFDQIDQYQNQNPDSYLTSVVGVPGAYATLLRNNGFHVITDSKSLQPQVMSKNEQFNNLNLMRQSHTESACINGQAAGFSCQNIALLGHLALDDFPGSPNAASDIWGHIDLNNGREYAIIGLNNGTSVVDISNPSALRVVGTISGQSTTWRDIKVYQFYDATQARWRAYAYITADNVSEGILVLDLSALPDSIRVAARYTDDPSAHNVYISNVDYGLNIALPNATPLLHISGSNRNNGAIRTYSLADPEHLSLSYQNTASRADDYSHDASSLLINDSRAQSDCVNASSVGCNVLLDFNENSLRISDHSRADSRVELSDSTYPNAEYTHSGWWTEDKRFVIVHDEMDEQNLALNTTLNIFDISSLTEPLLVGTWSGPTRAIDHNGFVRGNRYYMSNYERGLTVLDISDPANPQSSGFFDTYPVSDNAAFNGAWGVYPYLPSGRILLSDINSGLFVLRDETQGNNTLAFETDTITLSEGASYQLGVNKSGTLSTTVAYEVLSGSASSDDYLISAGQLSWASGDNSPRSIDLQITTDNQTEGDEVFFIRLYNPTNGSSLASPNLLKVNIAGPPVPGKISFRQGQLEVNETSTQVDVLLERSGGSAGMLRVNYRLQSGTAIVGEDVADASGILSWQDGDSTSKTLSLNIINDTLSEPTEQFSLLLEAEPSDSLGTYPQLDIQIIDDESNLPPTVNIGNNIQVNPRQFTQISASASDPENRSLSFLWQQTSGPQVSLQNANTATVSFTAPAQATSINLTLTVTDPLSASATDTVTVNVVSDNQPAPSGGGGGSLGILWLLLATLICGQRARRFNV